MQRQKAIKTKKVVHTVGNLFLYIVKIYLLYAYAENNTLASNALAYVL